MRPKPSARFLALAVLLGCSAAPAQPQLQTVSGVFQVVVLEGLGKGAPASTESLQYSLLTGTEALRLVLGDPRDAEKIPSGSVVEVTGYRTGRQFTIPADSSAAARIAPHVRTMSAAPAPRALGQRRVALLLVTFQNDPRQLFDAGTVSSILSGDVASFFQEASYGQFSIVGDVYGYISLAIDSACSQIIDASGVTSGFGDIENAGLQAAQSAGINLGAYDTVIFYGPELHTCTAGEAAATIGGTPGYVVMKIDPTSYDGESLLQLGQVEVTAHEIGHNLGLHHARFLYCGSAVYEDNALANCPYTEYGDIFDTMGASSILARHYNPAFKEFLGWLQPQQISATGVYPVGPYELSSSSVKALKIGPFSQGDTFYLAYRQPLGYDNGLIQYLGPYVYDGAVLNLGGNPSYLLNADPSVNMYVEGSSPGISRGQTYVDYANRFSVTTLNTSPAGIQLLVLKPGADAPTLAFASPTDGSTVTGIVGVSIEALDLSGISRVDLSLDGSALTSMTAAPYTYAWNALSGPLGQHVLGATAYNTAGASFTQQITVTVVPPYVGGLTNGASFTQAVAPGSIVSLFLDGFSLPTATAAAIPLPTNLGGVSVTIGSESLPFYYVSSTQLNVQLPWDLPAGANTVTVSGGGATATSTFNAVPAAPGIFVYGDNLGVVQNQDYTLNAADNPAKAGSWVTFYLTGIGPLDNPVGLGEATPSQPFSRATTAAQATIGDQSAQIYFLGMTPGSVGLAQADIQIPPTLAPGTYPVQIQMGSFLSNAPLITTN